MDSCPFHQFFREPGTEVFHKHLLGCNKAPNKVPRFQLTVSSSLVQTLTSAEVQPQAWGFCQKHLFVVKAKQKKQHTTVEIPK